MHIVCVWVLNSELNVTQATWFYHKTVIKFIVIDSYTYVSFVCIFFLLFSSTFSLNFTQMTKIFQIHSEYITKSKFLNWRQACANCFRIIRVTHLEIWCKIFVFQCDVSHIFVEINTVYIRWRWFLLGLLHTNHDDVLLGKPNKDTKLPMWTTIYNLNGNWSNNKKIIVALYEFSVIW